MLSPLGISTIDIGVGSTIATDGTYIYVCYDTSGSFTYELRAYTFDGTSYSLAGSISILSSLGSGASCNTVSVIHKLGSIYVSSGSVLGAQVKQRIARYTFDGSSFNLESAFESPLSSFGGYIINAYRPSINDDYIVWSYQFYNASTLSVATSVIDRLTMVESTSIAVYSQAVIDQYDNIYSNSNIYDLSLSLTGTTPEEIITAVGDAVFSVGNAYDVTDSYNLLDSPPNGSVVSDDQGKILTGVGVIPYSSSYIYDFSTSFSEVGEAVDTGLYDFVHLDPYYVFAKNNGDGTFELSAFEEVSAGTIIFSSCEMSFMESALTSVVPSVIISNCEFDSSASESIPYSVIASEFKIDDFVYSSFGFTISGLVSSFWLDNDFSYGIGGLSRAGIGAFYFYDVLPPVDYSTPKQATYCTEPDIPRVNFWDYLTTFWDFLSEWDRDLFENYWHAMYMAGKHLIKGGQRMIESLAPQYARTCVLEDYYDLVVGPMYSLPINLDPTNRKPRYIITPIEKILVEPLYDDDNQPVYRDLIMIKESDYNPVHDIGTSCYVVVKSKNEEISDRYFKINNLKSSDEPKTTGILDYDSIKNVAESAYIVSPSEIGRVKIESDKYGVDISEYDIVVVDDNSGVSYAIWGDDYLFVSVNPADASDIPTLVAMINSTTSGKWATLTDVSEDGETYFPIMRQVLPTPPNISGGIEFGDLSYFYEEKYDRYYPATGQTKSTYNYVIEVDGDLSYLGDTAFTIYLTTGRSYQVGRYVTDLPSLQTYITDPEKGLLFEKDQHYTFDSLYVEFNDDLFESGVLHNGDILYHPKTPIIEHILYEMYGNLVDQPDWIEYNYNNHTGKAAINTLLKSLQEASDHVSYAKALNVYYGLPVSPESAEVQGLFESYGYDILEINGSYITLNIKENEDLHPFIQAGCSFHCDNKPKLLCVSVIDRTTGQIQVATPSGETYEVGDKLYLQLKNRMKIKNIYAETDTEPGKIDVQFSEGVSGINHLISTIHAISNEERYPEIVVYGTSGLEYNFDGIYHITNAELTGDASVIRLSVYKRPEDTDPLYNDYIGNSLSNLEAGYIHIPWPTHKFINLYLRESNVYLKLYFDTAIDTIYDEGDFVDQYQILSRNVSVLKPEDFPDWYQFDHFKRYNGIDGYSSILELTNSMPGISFGKYFPSRYSSSN